MQRGALWARYAGGDDVVGGVVEAGEYSATVSVWGGLRRPGRMLYEVVRDEARLRFEFRKRMYLEEVVPQLNETERSFVPGPYSTDREMDRAYWKARSSLSSMKQRQIMRRISLMRPEQSFDLPGMIEMGERPVQRNAWTWWLSGVLAGGGIGAGGYMVSTTLSKPCSEE